MLDPPSRTIALILFAAISCCAFCTRAARSSAVIGFTSAVIGLSAASAGCIALLVAGACACALRRACPAEAEGEGGLHAAVPMPMPAAAPLETKLRRLISMACILHDPVAAVGRDQGSRPANTTDV